MEKKGEQEERGSVRSYYRLPEDLWKRVKVYLAMTGESMSSYLERLVESDLAENFNVVSRKYFER